MIQDQWWLFTPQQQNELLTAALWWFFIVWLAAVGGCVGSFLNVVWDRRGTERGIVYPPSECEECGQRIRWYHNLPVIGWLILRGKCYACGSAIPLKHPLVEALFAALFVIAGILSPWL